MKLGHKHPFSVINKNLKSKSHLILPKHIIIRDNASKSNIYFGPSDTTPSKKGLRDNKLECIELASILVISKKQHHDQHRYQSEPFNTEDRH